MKLTKTDYKLKVNPSSSFIVYICKDLETENTVLNIEGAKAQMLKEANKDWYYSVVGGAVDSWCCVPKFFHGLPLRAVVVEHNNGSWDAEPTYTCYIAD